MYYFIRNIHHLRDEMLLWESTISIEKLVFTVQSFVFASCFCLVLTNNYYIKKQANCSHGSHKSNVWIPNRFDCVFSFLLNFPFFSCLYLVCALFCEQHRTGHHAAHLYTRRTFCGLFQKNFLLIFHLNGQATATLTEYKLMLCILENFLTNYPNYPFACSYHLELKVFANLCLMKIFYTWIAHIKIGSFSYCIVCVSEAI